MKPPENSNKGTGPHVLRQLALRGAEREGQNQRPGANLRRLPGRRFGRGRGEVFEGNVDEQDEQADHSIPEGRRAMLRERGQPGLAGVTGEKSMPDSVSQTGPGPRTGALNHRAPTCGRKHAVLFPCVTSNTGAAESWLGAYLCICSSIKHLRHAGPTFHVDFHMTEHCYTE